MKPSTAYSEVYQGVSTMNVSPSKKMGDRKAIRKRNRLLKIHTKRNSLSSWEKYRSQRNFTTALIRSSKNQYYAKLNNKLQDPNTSSKQWWE